MYSQTRQKVIQPKWVMFSSGFTARDRGRHYFALISGSIRQSKVKSMVGHGADGMGTSWVVWVSWKHHLSNDILVPFLSLLPHHIPTTTIGHHRTGPSPLL